MTDREWLDKLDADLKKLQHNREKVPLEQLRTRYAKAYNALVADLQADADWYAARYLECLAFPRHPKDTAGNDWLDRRIAAILEEERRPGGRVDQYRAALTESLDRDRFEYLVWEIYDRIEKEAFDPYWQRHCRWVGEPGKRWIYNDITKKYWCSPDRRPDWWKEKGHFESGCWITHDWKQQDTRWPPSIKEEHNGQTSTD